MRPPEQKGLIQFVFTQTLYSTLYTNTAALSTLSSTVYEKEALVCGFLCPVTPCTASYKFMNIF
jgi:hypothetical protein